MPQISIDKTVICTCDPRNVTYVLDPAKKKKTNTLQPFNFNGSCYQDTPKGKGKGKGKGQETLFIHGIQFKAGSLWGRVGEMNVGF